VVGAEDTGEDEGGARGEILLQRMISVPGLVDLCDMGSASGCWRGIRHKNRTLRIICWMNMGRATKHMTGGHMAQSVRTGLLSPEWWKWLTDISFAFGSVGVTNSICIFSMALRERQKNSAWFARVN
jgi:hypothetical protein